MQSTLLTLGRASMLMLFAGLVLAACNDDNNEDNNSTTPTPDMAQTQDDMGSTEEDMGGTEEDMGAIEEDMGGTEEDMGGTEEDMGQVADGTAQVQVLHLADGAGVVDVYANGSLLIDDIGEKQSAGFFEVPAGVDLTLDVVAGDATDNSAPVFTVTLAGGLAKDANYIVAATGDATSTDDATKFRLVPIGGAQIGGGADTVSAMIIHGVDDAPAVDVVIEPGLSGETTLNDLGFAGYTANADDSALYLPINPADITFGGVALANINVADSDAYVAAFQTPDLNALVGNSVVIAATGSLADGTFGLTAFLGAPGTTTPSDGIALSQAARLQAIHNSADPAAAVVDVYGNGLKLIDDFAFRTATPFITVPAGADIDFNIAGPDSTDDSDPVIDGPEVELEPGSTNIVVASGLVAGVDAAAFELLLTEGQEALADPAEIAVKVHHGSVDTPAVGVRAEGADTNVIDSFEYKDFVGYVNLPASTNTVLEIINPANGDAAVVKTAAAINFGDFTTPVFVMASGSSGLIPETFEGLVAEPISLVAVLPDGTVVNVALVAP